MWVYRLKYRDADLHGACIIVLLLRKLFSAVVIARIEVKWRSSARYTRMLPIRQRDTTDMYKSHVAVRRTRYHYTRVLRQSLFPEDAQSLCTQSSG